MTVSRGLLARAAVALSPVLLLLLLFRGTTAAAVQDLVYADEDLMKASPLTVAQCRAGCLHKLVPRDVEATECEKKSDCWKCWKYCEVLQTEGKNMKNICEHNCTTWVVGIFPDTKQYSVVPSNWLIDSDTGPYYCKWPPFVVTSAHLQGASTPSSDWETYRINILNGNKTYVNFNKAWHMKVKVKYSSTETDDDDNNSKAKKRPLLNVSSDESDDPESGFTITPPTNSVMSTSESFTSMSNDPVDTAYKFPNINYDDPCLLQYMNPTSSSSSTSTMPTKSLSASTSMFAISDYQCTNLTLASSSNNAQFLSAVPNTLQSEEQTSSVQLQHDVGCQEACSFHDWHGGSQHSPVVEARGERALTIDSGTLRWPRPADLLSPSAQRLVYVIMRRRDPGTRRTWSQLGQTPGYKARLPKTTAPWTVRVLAVSAEGLVTIFSPAPVTATSVPRVPVESVAARAAASAASPQLDLAATSPPTLSSPTAAAVLHDLRDADIIIKSLGRDQILGIRLPLAARSAPQEESLRLMGDDDPSDTTEMWNLREVSMIHQKVLVIAEVAWDARQVHRPAYLVTWEIDGGGLKGNLFTDTTCVTLSLWPDTAYLIQVSLLGGADESVKMSTSPTLLLDTRSAVHSTAAAVEVTTAVAAVAEMAASDRWSDDGADEDENAAAVVAAAGVDTVAVVAGEEDVTAELSAPVAVAAGLGHAEWQLLAAAGAGVAMFMLLALVLAYRSTGGASPALHKVVRHDDAECPPLLDYAPRPLDFSKYLGRCRRSHQLLDEDAASQQEQPTVTHVRH